MPITSMPLRRVYSGLSYAPAERAWCEHIITLLPADIFESCKAEVRLMTSDTDQIIAHEPFAIRIYFTWTYAPVGEEPPEPEAALLLGKDTPNFTVVEYDDTNTEDGTAKSGYATLSTGDVSQRAFDKAELWLCFDNHLMGVDDDYRDWKMHGTALTRYRAPEIRA